MPAPKHTFKPPFNIVRCSHVGLTVTDLDRSRQFYETVFGLIVTEATPDALYLRGLEERQHHSLVLRKGAKPEAQYLGFKVGEEQDLDMALDFFKAKGLRAGFVERPHQGRTLLAHDPWGLPVELYAKMDGAELLLQKYANYRGVQPMRLDHFNIFAPDVQGSLDFYAGLGFRLTEYAEEDGPNGRIAAGWMHRKGNVHDLAFTNGAGPRLHHLAYWAPTALNIIHLCDVMATSGFLPNLERGPGRHGISNAFFLYIRDPDNHRIEIYCSDYQTVDPDLEPIKWDLKDPQRQTLWGAPAPRSWFEEGSVFAGVEPRKADLAASPIVAP